MADFQAGFNLVVCYYALGDAERMKKGFSKLLSIPPPSAEEEEDVSFGIVVVVVVVDDVA